MTTISRGVGRLWWVLLGTHAARGRLLMRILLTFAAIVIGFAIVVDPVRNFEAFLTARLAGLLGVGQVSVLASALVIEPARGIPFVAILTESCSSAASVLALVGLATLVPYAGVRRRTKAAAAAVGVVVVGNMIRLVASVGFGMLAGRSSLVLFHDVFGALLTFIYVIAGYLVMIHVMRGATA